MPIRLTGYIGVDYICHGLQDSTALYRLIKQTEISPENISDCQKQHNHHGRQQRRNGQVTDLLPGIGSVNGGRLKHLLIHTGDGRQINHGAVPGLFPYLQKDQHRRPGGRGIVKIKGLTAQGCYDMIENASFIVENVVHDCACHYPAYKVRQKHKGLRNLFESFAEQLVEKNGAPHLACHSQKNKGNIVKQCISCNLSQLP